MGAVAKFAIVNGKRVRSEAVLVPKTASEEVYRGVHFWCCSYDRLSIDKGGFSFTELAKKIWDNTSLELGEIEFLAREAPLPMLMRLVDLKRASKESENLNDEAQGAEIVGPLPMVELPIARWMKELGTKEISEELIARSRSSVLKVEYAQVRVVFDKIDWPLFMQDGYTDLIRKIQSTRPGVVLHGPPVQEIVEWLSDPTHVPFFPKHHETVLARLEQILIRLKSHGFHGLRAAFSTHVLKLVRDVGFSNSLVTNIDECIAPKDLAMKLYSIAHLGDSKVGEEQTLIDVWIPGLSQEITESTANISIRDFQLLRALALGSLCLDGVRLKRASSRFFSVDALRLAHACGANEFGFGASDEHTSAVLSLSPVEQLLRVVGPSNQD